jgi:hypothetical protein
MQDPGPSGERPAADVNPYASPQVPQVPFAPGPWMPRGPAAPRSPRQWRAFIRRRIRKYQSPQAVWQDAVGQGLAAREADHYIDEELRAFRRGAVVAIIVGAVIAFLGLAVTVGSYAAAASGPRGGTFLVWWGPIVFGVLVVLFGFVRLLRIMSL